jgi:uncharacterized protein
MAVMLAPGWLVEGFYRIIGAVVMSCEQASPGAAIGMQCPAVCRTFYWGYINHMKVSWTEAKRAKTLQERGLDFARAVEVFDSVHDADGGRSDEASFVTAGFLDGRLVVVAWTTRDETRHIMSMRYAHAKEQRLWKEEMERSR